MKRGRTRKDAFAMIANAIEALAHQPALRVDVFPGVGDYFEVGSPNVAEVRPTANANLERKTPIPRRNQGKRAACSIRLARDFAGQVPRYPVNVFHQPGRLLEHVLINAL